MESFQERTEEPTAKRLKEAKKRGDVPFSEDLFKTSLLICGGLLLWSLSSLLGKRFENLFNFKHLNSIAPLDAIKDIFYPFLWPMAFLMLSLFLLHFALYFLQRGFLFVAEKKKENTPSIRKGMIIPALLFLLKGGVMMVVLGIFLATSNFHFFTF